jgi:hypothetical protein
MIFKNNHKYEICVESKFKKPSFQTIERSIEPPNLIHLDIGDFKFVQTRGKNKYSSSFIDDFTRYCYSYLLGSKNKALKIFKHYKNEIEN